MKKKFEVTVELPLPLTPTEEWLRLWMREALLRTGPKPPFKPITVTVKPMEVEE